VKSEYAEFAAESILTPWLRMKTWLNLKSLRCSRACDTVRTIL
jgi:hypothetical protein